jgi:hypothetical protein
MHAHSQLGASNVDVAIWKYECDAYFIALYVQFKESRGFLWFRKREL